MISFPVGKHNASKRINTAQRIRSKKKQTNTKPNIKRINKPATQTTRSKQHLGTIQDQCATAKNDNIKRIKKQLLKGLQTIQTNPDFKNEIKSLLELVCSIPQ